MDDHHGQAGTDGDDGLGLLRVVLSADRPDQGRRDQVDTFDGQSGLLDGLDHTVDQIDVGRRHQDPPHLVALGGGVVGEDLRGEDGLIRRKRDHFLGLEAHRAVDLVVGDEGEVDLAGDGPEPGDADDDRGAGELAVLPELGDRLG